jgi:hypothetical protein
VNFEIDTEGRVLSINAPDRPRAVGKSIVETPWSVIVGVYRDVNGIRVPTEAEATWCLTEGPFTCWRAKIVEFRLRTESN